MFDEKQDIDIVTSAFNDCKCVMLQFHKITKPRERGKKK